MPGVLPLGYAMLDAQHCRLSLDVAGSVLVTFLIRTPLMLATKSSQAYFWVWFTLRLLADVNALRPSERARLRLHFLGSEARGPA